MEHRVIYTRLPYDSEIEYLQSSNTQWIDTLYKMELYDELRIKVQCLNDYKSAIFGSRGTIGTNFYQLYIDTTLANLAFGQHNSSTIYTQINSFQNNGINEIAIKDGICVCNGVSTQIPVGTENSLQNLAIFARRNQDSSVSYLMRMKLYYFQIYHNGTLVIDYIPVRKGSIGYLYDKVSKKLFGNRGTGNFILGPDVNIPIKRNVIYTDTNTRCLIATRDNTESEQNNNINDNTND